MNMPREAPAWAHGFASGVRRAIEDITNARVPQRLYMAKGKDKLPSAQKFPGCAILCKGIGLLWSDGDQWFDVRTGKAVAAKPAAEAPAAEVATT